MPNWGATPSTVLHTSRALPPPTVSRASNCSQTASYFFSKSHAYPGQSWQMCWSTSAYVLPSQHTFPIGRFSRSFSRFCSQSALTRVTESSGQATGHRTSLPLQIYIYYDFPASPVLVSSLNSTSTRQVQTTVSLHNKPHSNNLNQVQTQPPLTPVAPLHLTPVLPYETLSPFAPLCWVCGTCCSC